MSEIYGFSNAVSAGNSADELLGGIRRQIDAQNSIARDNFAKLRQGEKENKIVAQGNLEQTDIKDRAGEGEEGGKVMSAVNDLTAKKTGSSVDTSVKESTELRSGDEPAVSPETAPQSEGGEGGAVAGPSEPITLSSEQVTNVAGGGDLKDPRYPETSRLLGDGEFELRREKTDFDSDRLVRTTAEGRVLPSGESGSNFVVRAYPVNEGNPVRNSNLVNPIENNVAETTRGGATEDLVSNLVRRAGATDETASKAGNLVTRAVKSIGTEGGALGEGISGALKGATILTGGYDLGKDIFGGKGSFSQLGGKGFTADKVSNVANIASGGLEAAGLALDATGVGAVAGVPLQALGLISGAVGLGAGLIGDITGEKKQKAAVKAMPTISPSAKAPQQKAPAFQSAFQGGQLVQ